MLRKICFILWASMVSTTMLAQDGFSYAKPTGMMYYIVLSLVGVESGCPESHYWTPFFEDFTFENVSTNPQQTQWSSSNVAINVGNSMHIDADGNCTVWALQPGYGCSVPYLFNSAGTDYYSMAYCDNVSWSKGMYTSYIHGSGSNGGLELTGWSDNKTGGIVASNDTGYMYGPHTRTGSFTVYDTGHYLESSYKHSLTDATFPMGYVTQDCYAPASPLYVEEIRCQGITFFRLNGGDTTDSTYDPLQNGAVLTMEISDQATGELLHTLTATTGDWKVSLMGGNYPDIGDYKFGTVTFTKKENGEAVPFVIDRAVSVKISGLENENVDVGFTGDLLEDCILDSGMGTAKMHFVDPSGEYEISTTTSYSNPRVVSMYAYAIMDKVCITEDYSRLILLADGEENVNVDAEGNKLDFGGVQIQTALPWFDSDGHENYSLVGIPSWITSVNVEDITDLLTDGTSKNFYKLSFEAEENTGDDREGILYVQCKGYVDDTPISVTQLSQNNSDEFSRTQSYTDIMKVFMGGVLLLSEEETFYLTTEEDGTYTLAIENLIISVEGENIGIGTIHIPNIAGTQRDGYVSLYAEETLETEKGDDPDIYIWWGTLVGPMDVVFTGSLTDKLYAYITLKTSTVGDLIVEFGDDTTGIASLSAESATINGIYSVGGQRLNSLTKGVNIIRFADGTTKKIYVK